MTIIVLGHIRVGSGEGAKLRDLLVGHMAATNAEDGCDYYNFAYDAGRPRSHPHFRALGLGRSAWVPMPSPITRKSSARSGRVRHQGHQREGLGRPVLEDPRSANE